MSDEAKTKLENERYQKLAELAALEVEMVKVYKVLNDKLEKEKADFDVGNESAKDILKAQFEEVKKEYLKIFGTGDIEKDEDDLIAIMWDQNNLLNMKDFMKSRIKEYNDNLKTINKIKSYIKTNIDNLPEVLKAQWNKKVYNDFMDQCKKIDDKSCNLTIFYNIHAYRLLMRDMEEKAVIDANLKKINDQKEALLKIKKVSATRKERSPMELKIPPVKTSTEREPLSSKFSNLARSLLGSNPKQTSEGGKTVKRRNRKTKRQQKRRKNKSKAKNKCKK